MSTVTDPPPESDLNSGEYDQFIDQRLERVRFHLKTLDLLTGMLQVGLFVLVSLLIVVLVDHWIWDLSVVARVGCLFGVAGVAVALVIRSVLLPLFRSINPDYAAQTVEQAHPELKNGLISFLFFRSQKGLLRDGVFQGIEQQAAADLTSVPIDSAVDRSYLIKLGYGLVALVVVWVAYILLSPKSPLQTVQRVATPWKDIARPSQVQIEEVAPGDTKVYRGQTVEVRTKVFGLPEDTVPTIVYSTIDGQLANQSLPLTDDPSTGRYSGTLSMGTEGILQDLEYQIHAGDARSAKYRVRILDMPHIHVDRVQLDYPSYTQQATEIVQGEADLRAIEGTRVTVYATANQEIAQGQIVLQPTDDTEAPRRARLKIEASQREANFRFPLRLDGDRKQSLYRAYHLEFTNASGQNSEDSIEHTIEVLPDRRPVVDVLRPDRRTVELPENGSLIMEVRAVDPDFQLTRVQLAARTRGRNLFRESLLSTTNAAEWHTGQFTATYRFVPKELDLREGDVVEYLALAEDNRHDPVNAAKLDPNRTISAKQYVRITKADPRAESQPQGKDDTAAEESDKPDSDEPKTQDEGEKKDKQQDQGQSQGQEQRPGGDGEEQGQEQEERQGQDASEEQAGNQAQQNQEQNQDGQNANEQPKDAGGNESGLQQDSDRGGETDQESEGGGKAGESSDDNSKADGNSSESGNQPTRGGQESQDGQQAGDSTGDQTSGENSQSGDGDAGNRGGRENEPLPSSGERDGEVVERIREYMKDKGELEEYERQLNDSQDSPDSQDPTESGANSDDPSEGSESPADPNAANSPSSASNSDESNASGGDGANTDGQPEGSGSAGTADSNPSGDNAGDSADDSATSGASNPTGDKSETGIAETGTAEGSSGNQASESTGAEGTSEQNPQDGRQGQAGEGSGEATSEDRGEGVKDNAAGTEGRSSDNGTQPERSPQNNAPQPSSDKGPQEDASDSTSNDDRETGDRSDGASDSETGKPGQDASQQYESSKSPGQNSNPSDSNNNASSSNPTADRSKNQNTSPQQRPGRSQSASESGQTGSADAGDVDDTASGDAANLEYARESTDLVLEYLKDQKRKPNPELLEKLGWKQGDVDNFLRRWAQMKRDAQGSGSGAQKSKSKLDEILQGMGLRPPAAETRQVDAATDQQRNNRNTGRKQKIPKDLLDPFRAFQRGLQLDR